MTIDKIIKALECCEVRKKYFGATCVDCPFHDIGNCQSHLMTYTLHTIKQQQEEITNLQEKLDYIENSLKTDFCGVPCDFMEEMANKHVKNAIKEFAEKLHTKMTRCGYSGKEKLVMCPEREIDNLVKEMVGGEE